MDEFPDVPLDNFGGETEVATTPVAPEAEATTQVEAPVEEQTAQTEPQTNGSEGTQAVQPEKPEDNSIVEEPQSQGRPEKRDRLQARFGELTGTIKQQNALIENLNAQLAQNQAIAGIPRPTPDENGEYDVNALVEYNRRVSQASADASSSSRVAALEARLERESIANRVDSEGTQIETKYKEYFDADPSLAEDIKQEVEERIALANGNLGLLKQISPMKIADRYMRSITAERRRAQTVTAQNLQATQAQSGVIPETPPSPEDPNSDAALEARVADIKF